MKTPTAYQIEATLKVLEYFGTIANMRADVETAHKYIDVVADIRRGLDTLKPRGE